MLAFTSALPAASAMAANISTAAGTGIAGFGGDSGLATVAQLRAPVGLAAMADGGFLVADSANNRVREVSAAGVITTVAGSGIAGSVGDGGAATSAQLNAPDSVSLTADGGFLIADSKNNRIRKVSVTGTITTVAGTGVAGSSGDGGAATSAQLNDPVSVAATADGGFLIGDALNDTIRKVSATGTITTVAGTGVAGFSGDGGAATSARLNGPTDVAPTADGGYLVTDFKNNRIRKVSATGTITTVAGTGFPGFSGDGGPATAAQLSAPVTAEPTANGGFLIASLGNNRVRQVAPDGTITTVAGTGFPGFSGDGGPATAAELNGPVAAVATANGGFLISDLQNNRVRYVEPPQAGTGTSQPTTVSPTSPTSTLPRPGIIHISYAPLTLTAAGYVPVTVACSIRQTTGCRGTIILQLVLGPRHHKSRAHASRRGHPRTDARQNYALKPGQTKTVKVKMARRGRGDAQKARRHHRKVNVKISIVQQTPSGPRTSRRVVRLRVHHAGARR